MSELLMLLPFVLVPAVALAFIRPAGRRILGAIGLLVAIPCEFLIRGPDNPAQIFGFLGFSLAAAALLAEGAVFLVGLFRGHRRETPNDA